MRTAVCPGSFDPITNGHLDIIRRASKLFDHVIVAVSVNAAKTASFSLEERVEMIRLCTADIPNIEIDMVGENLYLSSSLIKQIAGFGGDISSFVPAVIRDRVNERFFGKNIIAGGISHDC